MDHSRLEFAESIAREAGLLAQRMRTDPGELGVELKGPQDFVTAADIAVETFIRGAIAKTYPRDGVVGEEQGRIGDLSSCWIIDPIDGTTNFMRGLPDWAISIAFYDGRDLTHGVIFAPDLNIMASAQIGQPATMNGQVIEVSKCNDLTKSLIVLGYSGQVGSKDHLDRIHRLLDAGCDYRKQGAATLGFVSVAAGRVEAYYEPRINVWDIAAGAVLVRSAGGVIIHPNIPDFLQTPGEVLAANKNALMVGEICRNTSKNSDIADQMDR